MLTLVASHTDQASAAARSLICLLSREAGSLYWWVHSEQHHSFAAMSHPFPKPDSTPNPLLAILFHLLYLYPLPDWREAPRPYFGVDTPEAMPEYWETMGARRGAWLAELRGSLREMGYSLQGPDHDSFAALAVAFAGITRLLADQHQEHQAHLWHEKMAEAIEASFAVPRSDEAQRLLSAAAFDRDASRSVQEVAIRSLARLPRNPALDAQLVEMVTSDHGFSRELRTHVVKALLERGGLSEPLCHCLCSLAAPATADEWLLCNSITAHSQPDSLPYLVRMANCARVAAFRSAAVIALALYHPQGLLCALGQVIEDSQIDPTAVRITLEAIGQSRPVDLCAILAAHRVLPEHLRPVARTIADVAVYAYLGHGSGEAMGLLRLLVDDPHLKPDATHAALEALVQADPSGLCEILAPRLSLPAHLTPYAKVIADAARTAHGCSAAGEALALLRQLVEDTRIGPDATHAALEALVQADPSGLCEILASRLSLPAHLTPHAKVIADAARRAHGSSGAGQARRCCASSLRIHASALTRRTPPSRRSSRRTRPASAKFSRRAFPCRHTSPLLPR